MIIRFARDDEKKIWNDLILKNPDGGNVFQSFEMTNFKIRSGWTPKFIVVEGFSEGENLYISVQQKKVFGLGKIWYLSKGAGILDVNDLADFASSMKDFARKNGVFAVKMESEIIKSVKNIDFLVNLGMRIVRPIQPNSSTILLDISKSEDEILSAMPRGGAKYSINRAIREGVEVRAVDSTLGNCRIFYNLLFETAKKSGFNIREFEYHHDFWKTFSNSGIGQMFFAEFNGEVVAVAYGFIFGEKSTYKDGASIADKKVYGASHLLQWEVIKWAKNRGSLIHDLCGCPPSDMISDKTHYLYGVGQFKSGFSKKVTDYVGAFDLVVDNLKYKIWTRFAEKALLRFYRKFKKSNWY